MDSSKKLGILIEQLRSDRGLSLRELAMLTGISHSYLRKLEQGVDPRNGKPISPSIQVLENLALGLGVKLEQLIFSNNLTPVPDNAVELKKDNIRMLPVLETITPNKIKLARKIASHWFPVDITFTNKYSTDMDSFFYLRAHGCSMDPIISNQELVLVFKGPVEEGDIGVVICDEKDTYIRKIYLLHENNLITLVSRNRSFPPITKRTTDCEIIGKVILRVGMPKW